VSARKRPYRLGLTGSIGMGKSTTAGFFRDLNVPVWDADAAVHRLYARGGAGVPAIAALAPGAIVAGGVDRDRLRAAVLADPDLLDRIEAAIHPLVSADRAAFIAENADAPLVVCDVPLLFETGTERDFDGVVVVSAPLDTQRARVLARPGMTEAALAGILARQMPDAEKRARADFVIGTGEGLEAARAAVAALVARLAGEGSDA
jgi:dephospho-CoA kinase